MQKLLLQTWWNAKNGVYRHAMGISLSAGLSLLVMLGLGSCGSIESQSQDYVVPPYIYAELDSFPPGAEPLGFQNAMVFVGNSSNGQPITRAAVVMNGTRLIYNSAYQCYRGNVAVAPGDPVSLRVAVGTGAYRASATQFNAYPAISTPVSGDTWSQESSHTVTWSAGGPADTGDLYGIGIIDTADPNGRLVWPWDNAFQVLPLGSSSYSIPPYSVTGGSRFIVVGIASARDIPLAARGSVLVLGGFNYVPITVEGVHVTRQNSGTSNDLFGIAWSGSQFAAVGDGCTILTSPDGEAWTMRHPAKACSLNGITWSGSQFAAVGAAGAIFTSPDGAVWTARASGTQEMLYGIAWSGTTFAAVGWNGIIITSPDGKAWTQRHSYPSGVLQSVTWSGTQFVAVGRNGSILTSPDGMLWTKQPLGVPISFLDGVAWSGTQFAVVGSSVADIILSSPDGVTWTLRASPGGAWPKAVTWTGAQFVAVGGPDVEGTILLSPDGLVWTRQAAGVSRALSGVAWSGSAARSVMVGWGGTIITSP